MAHENDNILEIRFPVTFTVIIVSITSALVVAYHLYASTSLENSAIFLGAAVTACGVIITAYYASRTLRAMIQQDFKRRQREDHLDQRGRKERSLRYGERWNDPSMYHVRDVFRALIDDAANGDIMEMIKGKETNVIHLLNFFEELEFSIEHGLAEQELLKQQFSGLMPIVWRTLSPWIAARRRIFNDDGLWEKVEILNNRWRGP